jgi:hypothetical protein
MPIHTTNIVEERAASVASKEAEKIWIETGNYKEWVNAWMKIYTAALKELAEQAVLCVCR